MNQADITRCFEDTGALLRGHFLLRSGLHSDCYFQAAIMLQHTRIAADVCAELARRWDGGGCDAVISPAVGGIVVGQEVGRALGVRAIFAEKNDASGLVLRRGFRIAPGERFLVAEDVVTRGGRVQQTIDLVRAAGGEIAGVGVLVDRSGGKADFGVPTRALVRLELATYEADSCPLCAQGLPLVKPGSK